MKERVKESLRRFTIMVREAIRYHRIYDWPGAWKKANRWPLV